MSPFSRWNQIRTCHPVLLSLVLLLIMPAAQATPVQEAWKANRTLEAHSGGLLYSLPYIDPQRLGSEVSQLSQQLDQRRQDLSTFIEKNSFTAKDVLIVAAMPGGLIYAAVKKQRSVKAEKELDQVENQLATLADPSLAGNGIRQTPQWATN